MNASPLTNRRNLDFMLYELLGVDRLCDYPRFADHSRDTFGAALDLAHQIALEKFLPHNRKSDLNEPHMVDGKVELIEKDRKARGNGLAELVIQTPFGVNPYAYTLPCNA